MFEVFLFASIAGILPYKYGHPKWRKPIPHPQYLAKHAHRLS